MTPEQERDWQAMLAEERRWLKDGAADQPVVLAVAAELRDLRAALAASQAREAALTELLRATWKIANLFCRRQLLLADVVEPILAGQSPDTVADALGRVVRASVAYRSAWADVQETDDLRARPMAERLAAMRAHIVAATALATEVDTLIAVAPWWGEPKEANRVK